jgi:hypothetical protein
LTNERNKKMGLVKNLKSMNLKNEKVNSNNAWGFGGAVKTIYYLNGFEIHIGKCYYRHLSAKKLNVLYDNENKIVTNNLKKINEFVNSYINKN